MKNASRCAIVHVVPASTRTTRSQTPNAIILKFDWLEVWLGVRNSESICRNDGDIDPHVDHVAFLQSWLVRGNSWMLGLWTTGGSLLIYVAMTILCMGESLPFAPEGKPNLSPRTRQTRVMEGASGTVAIGTPGRQGQIRSHLRSGDSLDEITAAWLSQELSWVE